MKNLSKAITATKSLRSEYFQQPTSSHSWRARILLSRASRLPMCLESNNIYQERSRTAQCLHQREYPRVAHQLAEGHQATHETISNNKVCNIIADNISEATLEGFTKTTPNMIQELTKVDPNSLPRYTYFNFK